MTDNEMEDFLVNPKKPTKIIKEERVQSSKSSDSSTEHKMAELDRQQKNLVNIYKNEPLVTVRVAPSYAKYFGRVMRVAINGVMIAVHCDGRDTQIPESFAAEVLRRMTEMDKYDLRSNRMSRIEKNFETSPGQISFFG